LPVVGVGFINGLRFLTADGLLLLMGVGVVFVGLLGVTFVVDLLGGAPNVFFDIEVDDIDDDEFTDVDNANDVTMEVGTEVNGFSQTFVGGGGAGVVVVVDDVVTLLVVDLFEGNKLFRGNIDKISASGSFTKAEIKKCACLVASGTPFIVIDRSPCVLPCFSTSI
jgi:Na+-transporting methylmalonyl-CoA/oxaloacetate decarboxylase gamma subunit